jgi:hypothetical protein
MAGWICHRHQDIVIELESRALAKMKRFILLVALFCKSVSGSNFDALRMGTD